METCDVVVIGGGLSGLSAAAALAGVYPSAKASSPSPAVSEVGVVVLEANRRLGGRSFTVNAPVTGVPVDLGGQWIGAKHNVLRELATALGVKIVPQHYQGKRILELNGSTGTYSTDIPTSLGLLNLIDLQQAMFRIERSAKSVDPAAPHTCRHAREWDATSVATAIARIAFTESVRRLLVATVRGIMGVEPADVSYLHLLTYCASAGSAEALVTIRNGNQEATFQGGSQQLTLKLAALLTAAGGRVHLNAEVVSVEHKGEGTGTLPVIVTLSDGRKFGARRAIVAVPPFHCGRLGFSPRLPYLREQLMSRSFIGCIIKSVIVYKTSFWRTSGFSGEVVSDYSSGPAFNVYDDVIHAPEKPGGVQPALVCFINGEGARVYGLKTADERRAAVLKQLAGWFGKEAMEPIEYLEKDWAADPYTNGCPVGVFPPGAMGASCSQLAQRVGPIHFASTETSALSQGFLDGAVRAGLRSAAEVASSLASPLPAYYSTHINTASGERVVEYAATVHASMVEAVGGVSSGCPRAGSVGRDLTLSLFWAALTLLLLLWERITITIAL